MKLEGIIVKMISEFNPDAKGSEPNVTYSLPFGSKRVPITELINRTIHLNYLNEIRCLKCGKITRKSYGQGYCYPCFISIPETDECILKPELCRAHLGISRDMEWAKTHCLQDHYVYLAVSSGVKVGVTRSSQIPTRWIDQGAWMTIKLARTPNRYLAGQIEVALKTCFADKTNWRDMLRNQLDRTANLKEEKVRACKHLPDDFKKFVIDDEEIWEFRYPVEEFPVKIKSLSFDTTSEYRGILKGIKGQYLLFDGGDVLNIRKHNGYLISMTW